MKKCMQVFLTSASSTNPTRCIIGCVCKVSGISRPCVCIDYFIHIMKKTFENGRFSNGDQIDARSIRTTSNRQSSSKARRNRGISTGNASNKDLRFFSNVSEYFTYQLTRLDRGLHISSRRTEFPDGAIYLKFVGFAEDMKESELINKITEVHNVILDT